MWTVKVAGQNYDLKGVLNNMRVYEEQQVPWLGVDMASDAGEEAE